MRHHNNFLVKALIHRNELEKMRNA